MEKSLTHFGHNHYTAVHNFAALAEDVHILVFLIDVCGFAVKFEGPLLQRPPGIILVQDFMRELVGSLCEPTTIQRLLRRCALFRLFSETLR